MTNMATDSTARHLRPLDRRTLRPSDSPVAKRAIPDLPTIGDGQERVSRLAQDAFISRSYELKNPAAMGVGLDGTMRSLTAVASDLEGLAQPHLTVGTGIALGGKLVRDAANSVVNGGRVIDGLRFAHDGLSRRTGRQAAAPSVLHSAAAELQPILSKVQRAGAIGSLGMATIALPSLAVAAVTRNGAAYRTLRDGTATANRKIDAIKDAAYTDAALVYTAVAIPSAIKTLAATGAATTLTTRAALAAKGTAAYRTAERFSGIATPVADATLLVADGLHLYTTMSATGHTGKATARAALNVGLDALKLSLYAFPQTRSIRLAYTAAGVTQLGFAVHGLIWPDKR